MNWLMSNPSMILGIDPGKSGGIVSLPLAPNGFDEAVWCKMPATVGDLVDGLRLEWVAPAVWQRAMGCLSKGDKNVTKRRAQELFPHIKVTHANADALLIAEYGRRLQQT